ncbi:MAG: DnaD domain protein [Chloroflexi bacterium]|nr:DnaD domain protein [Chloroflexota bacterium]
MAADPTSTAQFIEDGEAFEGFPNSGAATTVPSLFFSRVLPEIESAEELVVSVYSFFAQASADRKRRPRYVTLRELEADRTLMRTLARFGRGSDGEALRAGLAAAVKRGTLARAVVETEAGGDELFVANNPSNRKALEVLDGQRLELEPSLPRTGGEPVSNIFTLYEENIGSITPLIAEDLKEAEDRFPVEWIREAMKEAVLANKRSWRYVHTILRRWETEGPDYEESERDPQIEWLERRYVAGRRAGRTSRS